MADHSEDEETQFTSALIIIDMQNDFCEGYIDDKDNEIKQPGSIAIEGSIPLIKKINELRCTQKFDYIITTRDFHPKKHVSFADTHQKMVQTEIQVKETGLTQMLWPTHCVQGTHGCEYVPGLIIEEQNDIEILKGQLEFIDSYSAFGGMGEETNLAWNLRERFVKKVFCVGLAFDHCVGWTAVDAAHEGFETYLIKDATKSITPESEQNMAHQLDSVGVKVIQINELKDHLEK